MALSDWELYFGNMGTLTAAYKVHGQKALYMVGTTGMSGLVHQQTYNDAPLNVRIDTWIFREIPSEQDMNIFIGGLARVNKQTNAHFMWYLALLINYEGYVTGADFIWVAQVGDQQPDGGQEDVTGVLQSNGLDDWRLNHWRWVRIEGFESGGKFHVSIAMTPDISTPDPDNPPENQLIPIASKSMIIPSELSSGGGCGLVVGCQSNASDNSGAEIIDYTQIYY